ncbi:hypothetical protein HZZ13_23310 [Bradyrhizobium sp. CNPSo 4010]|uniref:Uncharacterized protein n=1 Tax=Bradyrhizobium agreste TaxID=2751811 RepID=A0ABS0PU11_9BRAD|nr:hypothetical protein [Bradyrhizobium agreste]MBH5400696.1 hypothetical protein [Bradyrhizobium agreste]
MVLSTVLRIKRTRDGREIDDEIIADVATRKSMAIEQNRRAEWREAELAAGRFRATCDHAEVARLSSSAHDPVR